VLKHGAEYVLFKNKDLHFETFDDSLLIEAGRFGVVGIHLPPSGRPEDQTRSGFSIGLNRHGVSACNSHVKSLEGGLNYDLLTEAAVTGTRSAREACGKVVEAAADGPYNWSNIIVADPNEVAIVEIGEDVAEATGEGQIARANSHLLPHGGQAAGEPGPRGARAIRKVEEADSVGDIFALLRSHEGRESKTNICSHKDRGNTVYSYVWHWRGDGFDLYAQKGHPCEGEYVRIPLRFPLEASQLADYPR
jgi:hypothetical protein